MIVSARGVVFDEDSAQGKLWDFGVEGAVGKTAEGWTVELIKGGQRRETNQVLSCGLC